MFANGKSILVQSIQKDTLFTNEIDCRLIDVQQKIIDLLSAGYVIYDVAETTNSGFNNLIASSSGNRICVWKSAGSTAYTLYSTELASNGTNVIVNATLNNMNQVTQIRDCKLTCSASSGLFANKAEFYGGDWYLASWTTGSNVKFTNCDVIAETSEVYMPDVNFEYCNVRLKKSGTIAYSTYKVNTDTRFVNETTAGSTVSTLTLSYAYTTVSDWFLRCTLVDWQNTGTALLSSTASRTLNFTGLKIENSNLSIGNMYTTEGNKIYYEGQNITLSGSVTGQAWAQLGTTNISSSSGLYPSLAFNQSGIPYVAFQDNSTSSVGKASCYKYGSTGWQVVGYTAFTTNTMDYINLAISTDNDIVVVGRDNSSKASAYYFSAAASSWNLLGSAGFSSNLLSEICIDYYYYDITTTGIKKYIYALTRDSSGIGSGIYRYNISDSSGWTFESFKGVLNLGFIDIKMPRIFIANSTIILFYQQTPGTTASWSSISGSYYPSSTILKISCLDNYISFIDGSSKINVIYNISPLTTGTPLGYLQFSTGTAQNLSLSVINSIPYVAIQDTTAKATCYKYVAANSSWNLVGTANFSTDNIGLLSLASFNNIPYLAVEEKAAPGITLYKFDEVSSPSNINYSFMNYEDDMFDGEKVLAVTSIQTSSNYIVQNCNVKPIYNIRDTAIGRFITNSYNIELSATWNPTVNETLKETNIDTFWVVKREDIEATLDGKIIKNLKLYDSGLNLYDYKSNDNFIIIANSASKGNAVFCFYNNKIKGTVFSDNYFDESYTITDCFILMEVSEINDLQNVVSSTALTDGPLLSGSILFNSYDNEIIL